jgi:hypothetical protein
MKTNLARMKENLRQAIARKSTDNDRELRYG